MTREAQIEKLLTDIAPFFLAAAQDAQTRSDGLSATQWARENLARTASYNQVSGTARWRILGDTIVTRQADLPADIELRCTDEEQNQGRYLLASPDAAIVLTLKRKPHAEDEVPEFIQTQLQSVLDEAPVEFTDEIRVYLAVPAGGNAVTFEVATKGKETFSRRLVDLIDDGRADGTGDVVTLPLDPNAPSGPRVRSVKDIQEVGDGKGESEDKRG